MNIAVFDTHKFEKETFEKINQTFDHQITFFETKLSPQTAQIAAGFPVVCAFVNDKITDTTLEILAQKGLKLIALRSAGFNNIDLKTADSLGIKVVRVPAYSPYAIAEHSVLLILALNRKVCRANARVREHNFSLEGLIGFDLYGKTIGIVGTGRIGIVMAKIMMGFGCQVLAYDLVEAPELANTSVRYVSLDELYQRSDIISLHIPLMESTRHMIQTASIAKMKKGVMIINTGRGALINSKDLIDALKSGHVGAAGLDVYEEEQNVFFEDLSEQVLQDDLLARLLSFPNVLITSHQAFLTQEALTNIVTTTLQNVKDFELGKPLVNEVRWMN